MSVRTDADEYLERFKSSLEESIYRLSLIVINHCDGWDAWNEEYQEKQRRALIELVEIRARLFDKN